MKRIALTSISLFFTIFSFAQSGFSDAFKEFDNRKIYKGIPFGSTLENVQTKTQLTLIKGNQAAIYIVEDPQFQLWFNINFNRCSMTFNKKKQLYEVFLLKFDYDHKDYDSFIIETIKLLGQPSLRNTNADGHESVCYFGKNINMTIKSYPGDFAYFHITITCKTFDDSSPSDKLY